MYIQLTPSVGLGKGAGRGRRKREVAGRKEHTFSMFMRQSVRKRRKPLVPSASGLQCLSTVATLTLTVEFNGNYRILI